MTQKFHFWTYIQKKLKGETLKDIYALMFTAALFSIAIK